MVALEGTYVRRLLHQDWDTTTTIDSDALERVADRLLSAPRVLFAAVGTSAPLAADMAYRLQGIGMNAYFMPDAHTQHVVARTLNPADACLAISHTGSTTETLMTAQAASVAGAATAAVTSFAMSPLTEIVEEVLVAGSRETNYRIEAMTSRIVHLTLLDTLFVLLALRREGAAKTQALVADVLSEHRI